MTSKIGGPINTEDVLEQLRQMKTKIETEMQEGKVEQEDELKDVGQSYEVDHRISKADTLWNGKSFTKQRIINSKNLYHTTSPSNTLIDVIGK